MCYLSPDNLLGLNPAKLSQVDPMDPMDSLIELASFRVYSHAPILASNYILDTR